jgi:opacity protein-like surface antigen
MRDYTFLFGPHFAYRRKKATTFAHALFGAAHSGVRQGNDGGTGSAADTSFAMAIGGGFDVNLTRSFAWRVQTDYLQTRFSSEMQNNLRVSTGIVLRIGK